MRQWQGLVQGLGTMLGQWAILRLGFRVQGYVQGLVQGQTLAIEVLISATWAMSARSLLWDDAASALRELNMLYTYYLSHYYY